MQLKYCEAYCNLIFKLIILTTYICKIQEYFLCRGARFQGKEGRLYRYTCASIPRFDEYED